MRRTHHKDFIEFTSPNPDELLAKGCNDFSLRKKNLVKKQRLERIT